MRKISRNSTLDWFVSDAADVTLAILQNHEQLRCQGTPPLNLEKRGQSTVEKNLRMPRRPPPSPLKLLPNNVPLPGRDCPKQAHILPRLPPNALLRQSPIDLTASNVMGVDRMVVGSRNRTNSLSSLSRSSIDSAESASSFGSSSGWAF
ncbi:hypothetical protein E3Q15_02386 [Wallemia mellicola]|uniref:Uncharacterized protein n=2 Tax=Wallemia mellicola TaxID=1708541 RepID=A0A4T0R5C2_9BASI|nr:hypothetical protein E3Q14_02503 [Wallemia mellicola]TIC12290.1 hypothetical protein E3Q15_02386 [Wallemia mellicola]TIC20597.1 hypothetical protein E3Q13_00508 [Wallemia mellicola]TIC32334.1 hypothetical protein E3Q11_00508 [Wallemia mellicola]TIC56297.1 hypothetical protein E3Q05_01781 [Wallemia mellicola]